MDYPVLEFKHPQLGGVVLVLSDKELTNNDLARYGKKDHRVYDLSSLLKDSVLYKYIEREFKI
jgi:hypothetical protein